MTEFTGLVSEFSTFVMINTVDQTMELTSDVSTIKTFLEMSPQEIIDLKTHVSGLQQKEDSLRTWINEKGGKVCISYERKLFILKRFIENF
jgi:N-methylhydantoinase B/oxoprolinase/acetone carboxylase alpha subunit